MKCLTGKGWGCRFALIVCALSALLSSHAFPAESPEQAVAKAVSVQGTVEVRRVGQTQWQPVKLDDAFRPGDSIRVGERSRADLQLLNQSVLRLNANSSLTVEAPKEAKTGVVDLLRGAVHFFSRGPNSLEVKTPFTVAGVRGTEFLVSLEPKATLLTVFEGTVDAQSPAGSLTLRDGQSAIAEAGKAPVTRIVARPRDAVHWALYYPPVIQDRQAPAYRAQMLLAVGAVDEARSDIQHALVSAPNNADALSLQSIMTLVQGNKDEALQIAQKAVEATPQSATALIARSYAQQARFNLEAARADVQKAVELEPRNALAWARLAELQSAFGEYDKTTEAAQKAVALDPNLARTQTVLGFAHLTSIRTKQARETFEKAIALDQADPLPRLGLGLAKIRDGELEAGGRDIEVAASLDPSNALVRSYLGKVYYEEKRTGLDEREYAMAKKLDPKDPTPWFYDAITKQTTNRPVEALQDMEKAIELNDNRAVYRSRLLLDSDDAARSAAQGRIYTDLGFQQLALVEGWKSVNTDPTNFSSHRLLADTYSGRPRHEIARVSELLQSQLLQPLNMTPIQPRLGESNLFLVSAGGPGALSFNEFNPIFNRDGVTVQATALAGSNSTWAGEGVVAGIKENLSFSVGYTQFETDGWRQNADQEDRIGNIFLQYELSPETSVQAEYRYRKTERGDLRLRFFPDEALKGLRLEDERDTYRLGVRHAFTPSSVILGSFTYADGSQNSRTDQLAFPVNFVVRNKPQKAGGAEVQHLYRSADVNLVSGIGYFDIDATLDTTVDIQGLMIPVPFPPFVIVLPAQTIVDKTDADVRHTNGYVYSYIRPVQNLMLTVGASVDYWKSNGPAYEDETRFNPKLGVTWNPYAGTTVRGAVFSTLKRTLITDQTLEPTQVAGFNQFYDDYDATKTWLYGLGVDQKFTTSVFGGLEFSKRKLTVPFQDANDPTNVVLREEDQDENLGRGYLFWTPKRWLALSAEYAYEKLTTDGLTDQPKELKTQRVPLQVSLFDPSGLSAYLKGTYYKQDGNFVLNDGSTQSGKDDFFIVDAGINFRLPKRYGFISVGATNLFDQDFRYFDRDIDNPSIQPERMVFVRATLALP